jgi:alkylation response protein AidB-like acyl-CoA dehydrogenase
MYFDFTEDQVMLRNLVREFLSEQCPVSHVREMLDDEVGFSRDIYRQFVQLGILPFPENYGGGDLGMVEQAIILEEMGRIPYPGPYFATMMLAGSTLAESDDQNAIARYLPDVSNGDLVLTLAFMEDDTGWTASTITAEASKSEDSVTINGRKRFVPFAHASDTILVVARTPGSSGSEGISIIAVPKDAEGVSLDKETMFDLTSRTATVTLENVTVPAENVVGEFENAWPVMERVIQRAAVGAAAEMLGASRKSLEMSVEYAKERKQFGQFIGQFQAVKHMLADMLEKVENGHAVVYYAAWAIDAEAPDRPLAVSVAKSILNESSKQVCGDAIQAHGGIGFTWEHDLHFYFKRAKHLEPLYGDCDQHYESVLNEVLAGRTAGAELE